MKKRWLCSFAGLMLLLAGCATRSADQLFQVSTINALLAGAYDGQLSCAQLKKHGDFGIGTFDRLDGEMVLLDGTLYQVRSDGTVSEADLKGRTPFATVCRFEADQRFSVPRGCDFPEFERLADQFCPNPNLFYAIKVTGHFAIVKTRSVPAQKKPYPALKEATAHQPEFERENVVGTLVGFRCPPYVQNFNVPGYHMHFLSSDRSFGGHVLRFEVIEAVAAIDVLSRYEVDLTGVGGVDLTKDRSLELKQIENER